MAASFNPLQLTFYLLVNLALKLNHSIHCTLSLNKSFDSFNPHQVNYYIAEFWNTVSNLCMIGEFNVLNKHKFRFGFSKKKENIEPISCCDCELFPVPACYGLWSVRKEALETRWNGEVVKWWSGEMVKWWNGGMVKLPKKSPNFPTCRFHIIHCLFLLVGIGSTCFHMTLK